MLQQSDPEVAKFLLVQAQKSVNHKWQQYKQLAAMKFEEGEPAGVIS